MAIELSNITFTDQDDIVPLSGAEQILNTGVANALAGNDTITGGANAYSDYEGIINSGTFNSGEGNDVINGYGHVRGIINSGTLNTAEGNDTITADSDLGNGLDNIGTFNTGEGNDLITTFGYDTSITNSGTFNTAEGNDTITAGGRTSGLYTSGTFNTGEGDDVITGSTSRLSGIRIGGIFDTGDGNDRIRGLGNSVPHSTIGIYNGSSSTFNTGDGNDTIEGQGAFGIINKGLINTGNGKDIIIADKQFEQEISIENFFTIDTGDDDDIITGNNGISNKGNIDTGNGDDSITARFFGSPYKAVLENFNVIETGEGNDIITSSGGGVIYNQNGEAIDTRKAISNDGTINTGNGQDSLIFEGDFTNRGGVFLGEGNDSITASIIAKVGLPNRALENFNFIGTGDGNDTITSTGVIYNEGVIETGNGDDSIIVNSTGTGYGIYNNGGAINMGDGNDSIIANQGFESGSNSSGAWFLGEGDDYIKGYGSGDFYGGNGNDTLELTPGTYTVGIWDTSPIFTKGNQLMITSEFEKLKAGSTIYDFTSLTAGQIITVP
jgi:hypothetical protein